MIHFEVAMKKLGRRKGRLQQNIVAAKLQNICNLVGRGACNTSRFVESKYRTLCQETKKYSNSVAAKIRNLLVNDKLTINLINYGLSING